MGNGLGEEERERTDDIYYIKSIEEGNPDQDGNAFEMFDDEISEDDIYFYEETLLCAFIFRRLNSIYSFCYL